MSTPMENEMKRTEPGTFHSPNPIGAINRADVSKSPKELTRDEWVRVLSPFQFAVMRERNTERAGSGVYLKTTEAGTYHCGACGASLFGSEAKFQSSCGWPSFSCSQKSADGTSNVGSRSDFSFGLERIEIYCQGCNSHLGHLFDDGPKPTRQRYCVNSAALEFLPSGKETKK